VRDSFHTRAGQGTPEQMKNRTQIVVTEIPYQIPNYLLRKIRRSS